MKSNDIDQLLNDLLRNITPPEPEPPSASEESRRRVEELLKSMRSSSFETAESTPRERNYLLEEDLPSPVPAMASTKQPSPAPVVSHFSRHPSQSPPVRMHDRLDAVSLHLPKDALEEKKAPKEIPTEESVKPKRIIPHIEIPDELPPNPDDLETPLPLNTATSSSMAEPILKEMPTEPETTIAQEGPILNSEESPTLESPKPRRRLIPHIVIPDELPPNPDDTATKPEEIVSLLAEEPLTVPITTSTEGNELSISLPEQDTEDNTLPITNSTEPSSKKNLFVRFARRKKETDTLNHEISTKEGKALSEPELPENISLDTPIDIVEDTAEEPIATVTPPTPLPVEPESITDPSLDAITLSSIEQSSAIAMQVNTTPPKLRHLPEMDTPKKGLLARFFTKKKLCLAEDPSTPSLDEVSCEISHVEENATSIPEGICDTLEEPTLEASLPTTEEIPPTDETANEKERDELVSPNLAITPELVSYEEGSEDGGETVTVVPLPEIEEEQSPTIAKHTALDTDTTISTIDDTSEENPSEDISSIPSEEELEPIPSSEAFTIDVALPEEEKRSAIFTAIRSALDQNAQELADMKAEPIPSDIDIALPKFWKRNRYYAVGVICTLLSLVGLYTCGTLVYEQIYHFAKNTALQEELESALYPVAVVDLPAFDSVEALADSQILAVAMMDLLMYGDLSDYTVSFDVISIPAEELANNAARLFGISADSLTHVSFTAAGESCYYDTSSECYNVSASPTIFSYAPDILSIKRTGDGTYTVTVAYVSDTAQWEDHSSNFTGDTGKTMEITLCEIADGYQILSIVNISDNSLES